MIIDTYIVMYWWLALAYQEYLLQKMHMASLCDVGRFPCHPSLLPIAVHNVLSFDRPIPHCNVHVHQILEPLGTPRDFLYSSRVTYYAVNL